MKKVGNIIYLAYFFKLEILLLPIFFYSSKLTNSQSMNNQKKSSIDNAITVHYKVIQIIDYFIFIKSKKMIEMMN